MWSCVSGKLVMTCVDVHLVRPKLLSVARSLLYFITATRDFYTFFLLRIEQKIIDKNY